MESNETENVLNEEVQQQDGLQLVKDINKYLRKALKKIETIQRNSDQLQQDASIQIQNDLQQPVYLNPSEDSEIQGRMSSAKRQKGANDSNQNSANISSELQGNSNGTISDSQDEEMEPDKEMEPDEEAEPDKEMQSDEEVEPDEEAEPDGETEPDEEAEPDQENEPGEGEELENNDSDNEGRTCEAIVMPLPRIPCIVSKLESPTNFLPLSVFYKAFLANLPLTVNVPKLKAWLESKGVSNYEDIIIYTKQTYKTSIVSYYDKNARDRLLLLDGELCESWPIKVRLHVDRFAPEVDRLASTKGQKRKH